MKAEKILNSLVMAIHMCFSMSAIITMLHTGLDDGFIQRWLYAFYISVPFVFLALLIFKPFATITTRKIMCGQYATTYHLCKSLLLIIRK